MLSSIACAVDVVQSVRFRLIDAGKPVGVTDGIRKASEVGLAQTVQAEKAGSLAW